MNDNFFMPRGSGKKVGRAVNPSSIQQGKAFEQMKHVPARRVRGGFTVFTSEGKAVEIRRGRFQGGQIAKVKPIGLKPLSQILEVKNVLQERASRMLGRDLLSAVNPVFAEEIEKSLFANILFSKVGSDFISTRQKEGYAPAGRRLQTPASRRSEVEQNKRIFRNVLARVARTALLKAKEEKRVGELANIAVEIFDRSDLARKIRYSIADEILERIAKKDYFSAFVDSASRVDRIIIDELIRYNIESRALSKIDRQILKEQGKIAKSLIVPFLRARYELDLLRSGGFNKKNWLAIVRFIEKFAVMRKDTETLNFMAEVKKGLKNVKEELPAEDLPDFKEAMLGITGYLLGNFEEILEKDRCDVFSLAMSLANVELYAQGIDILDKREFRE